MFTPDGWRLGGVALFVLAVAALAASPARAADTTVAPGQDLTLMEDVVLTGADMFTAGAADGPRCKIHGNGFGFLADKNAGWKGSIVIRNCDLDTIGTADIEAFLLTVAGNGKLIIENSTLSRSGLIDLTVSEHVDVMFNNNTVAPDNVYPEVKLLLDSPPFFHSSGPTDGMRVIQGNLIQKGRIKLTSTSGWTIGGSMPGEGNVLLGTRVGIELENADQTVVTGNYSHTLVEGTEWNQVKNLSINGGGNNLIEHNVFWGRNWLVEMSTSGELRYNLLLDAEERGWVLTYTDSGAKIHHNIAVSNKKNQESPTGGFVFEAPKMGGDPSDDVYNNTMDLGGKCNPGVEGAIVMRGGSHLPSLRSNAFTGVRVPMMDKSGIVDAQDMTEPPEHLDYADYNLFFNPDSPTKKLYSATVAGKTERVDAGFALNDVPKGGAVDQQVDPMFTGPIPRVFPFDEAMITTRATTTCQILAYYRKVYTPMAGSPLIDAGDPMDKAGNDVGAVGAGADNADDLFGRLCDENDVGTPLATADVFMCPTVQIAKPGGGGGGGGGPGPVTRPEGITCVCDAGAAGPRPGGAAAGLALAAALFATRRRRRRTGR
jgi:MYXO-CTERM domain-containing protein